MDWFLYDNGLRPERVKQFVDTCVCLAKWKKNIVPVHKNAILPIWGEVIERLVKFLVKCSNFLLKMNLPRQNSLVLNQVTLALISYLTKAMGLGVCSLTSRKHLTNWDMMV